MGVLKSGVNFVVYDVQDSTAGLPSNQAIFHGVFDGNVVLVVNGQDPLKVKMFVPKNRNDLFQKIQDLGHAVKMIQENHGFGDAENVEYLYSGNVGSIIGALRK